jgi:predicted GNAT family acetyltransferase
VQNDASAVQVRNNAEARRFEARVGSDLAVVEYEMHGDTIDLKHTIVPPKLEGAGLGSALAEYALQYARLNSLCVIPTCTFIAAYIESHPEYADLVAKR